MKSFHYKLFRTYSIMIGLILACLGLVLGQLFPIYVKNSSEKVINTKIDEVSNYISSTGLTTDEQKDITSMLDASFSNSHLIEPHSLWLFLFIILSISFLVSLILGTSIFKKYAQPIEHLTETAMELARGNYRIRAFEDDFSGMSKLSNSINILARNLHDISVMRETEKERLKTLIENMGSALIMMDRNGYITIVNRSFLKQLTISFEDVDGKLFKKIGLPKKIEAFIDQLFLTEAASREQISIKKNLHTYYMDAYGAPVIGEHGKWLGIVVVMHDITELVKLEQVRKDFVANVSHELKTPVTSIKGFSETLLYGAYKNEDTLLSFLEIIHKESNRLQMLINDLLDLSKVEQVGYEMNLQKVNLLEVVERSKEMTNHIVEEKNMRIETIYEEPIYVLGDLNRLIQITMNLLMNALTYSPEEKTVTISIDQNEKCGILRIQDEGIGIAKEEINRVFERFYRVDRARSRNSGGTGLGLAIVKHLVEAHHGLLEVESEVGKGTVFTVSIPLVKR
ncbi:two-component system, OmpR family, phosphate regulon sensor histidine kinase PhoR [Psychrobacillus sp. OK028]|uniref:two-component system histidine kinase PnpS n=1 Tax=Psychrobacillus sp. OK028 TaxID=1884359 RepID=UPI00087FFF0A|nr:ATP-binding protein [Psychrobacillus sp. OK028]SDM75158.1 two-component system, OmpR family, phosphate regulon sensor histidine kinase PhoR [Psychrobacillus sp. OK028]